MAWAAAVGVPSSARVAAASGVRSTPGRLWQDARLDAEMGFVRDGRAAQLRGGAHLDLREGVRPGRERIGSEKPLEEIAHAIAFSCSAPPFLIAKRRVLPPDLGERKRYWVWPLPKSKMRCHWLLHLFLEQTRTLAGP